ncbi:MAG: SDR family oxidoreductase [Pseudomonadota bacterium]
MNVLITGGAGYVGYSVVRKLLHDVDHVHSITIYDNLSRSNYSFFTEARFDHKPVKFVQADILDGRSLRLALEGIDCVIHLAARVTTPADDSDAHSFDQVNQWGTAQIATAIEQSAVQRMVYVSSAAIYGQGDEILSEKSAPRPFSVYGHSKLGGERQLEALKTKKDVYILRSANVYGYNPAYRIDAVINKFMFQANFHRRIQIFGSGEQTRSFIHVDTLATAILGAVDGDYERGVYNVVKHEFSINELAEAVTQIYPDLEVIHVNHNLRPRDVRIELPGELAENFDYVGTTTLDEELSDFKKRFSF